MATAEERQKILDMVAAGNLSAQEAAALLNTSADMAEQAKQAPVDPDVAEAPPAPVAESAAEKAPQVAAPAKEKGEAPASRPSWLRVRISDLESGRSKVSVNIPLGLMKAGLQIGGSFAPELRNLDWERFSSSLTEAGDGLLVEVEDEDDGEHVRIFIE